MAKFVPPTIEEVKEFANSIGFKSLNADKWWHHYNANGWKRGQSKMSRWKSAVWTWFYDSEEYRESQRKRAYAYRKKPEPKTVITPATIQQRKEIATRMKKAFKPVPPEDFEKQKQEQLRKLAET